MSDSHHHKHHDSSGTMSFVMKITKVAADFIIFAAAFTLVWYVQSSDVSALKSTKYNHTVPLLFDVFTLEPVTVYQEAEDFFQHSIENKDVAAIYGDEGNLTTYLRTAVGCERALTSGSVYPSFCELCADRTAARVFAYSSANGALTMTGPVAEHVNSLRDHMVSCIFRENKFWEARFYGYTNPWLHFLLWCTIMFVTSAQTHVAPQNSKDSSYFWIAQTFLMVVLLGVFVMIVFFSSSVSNLDIEYRGKKHGIKSYGMDIGHTLMFVGLAMLPVVLLSVYNMFSGGDKDDKSNVNGADSDAKPSASHIKDIQRTLMLDYSFVLVSFPVTIIVCAFHGWLEYNIWHFALYSMASIFILSMIDDLLLLQWSTDTGNKQSSMFQASHFFIFTTMLFVIVFFMLTNFPSKLDSDPFYGNTGSFLFKLFLVSITLIPVVVSGVTRLSNRDEASVNTVMWCKESLEFFSRTIALFWLSAIFQRQYTLV